jgi:hypothetical protein
MKFQPPNAGTITVTPLTKAVGVDPVLTLQRDGANVTNVTVATTSIALCTNATATVAAAELGRKLYASAGNIVFTFTPNSEESLSENTAGSVRVFFKLIEPKK